jgi:hypothetical protein
MRYLVLGTIREARVEGIPSWTADWQQPRLKEEARYARLLQDWWVRSVGCCCLKGGELLQGFTNPAANIPAGFHGRGYGPLSKPR